MKQVLFFSPYSAWHYHAAVEATLAHALEQRGAQVQTVLCDGRFGACDIYRANLNPRQENSCAQCQQKQSRALSSLGRAWIWLGRYISPERERAIDDWARDLELATWRTSRWQGHPVGVWAESSVLYQFRRTTMQLEDPDCARMLRQGLRDTAIAIEAVSALLDELKPDLLILLNGRFFAHRVAIELARLRGIRFVTHERGASKDGLMFRDGRLIHDLAAYEELWRAWKQVPLSPEQVRGVRTMLADRRYGKGLSWTSYSPPPEERQALRARLCLDERPIVAIFSSSEDEVAAFPEWSAGAFPRPFEWLDGVVALAGQRPDLQFVLRLHPALERMGASAESLNAVDQRLAGAPANLTIISPGADVSSYTLCDLAAAAIVTLSTLGLEFAADGKPVLSLARGWYGQCEAVDFVSRPEDLEPQLERVLRAGASLERASAALRFLQAYYHAMTQPFPALREEPAHHGKPSWSDASQLGPGIDAQLDRICDFLLSGKPLGEPPVVEDAQAANELEAEAIRECLPALNAQGIAPSLRWIESGEQLWQAGEAERACAAFERALSLEPQSSRAWNDLGVVLHASGMNEEARECFARALDCPGSCAQARENLDQVDTAAPLEAARSTPRA